MKKLLSVLALLTFLTVPALATNQNVNLRAKNSDGNWIDQSVDANGYLKVSLAGGIPANTVLTTPWIADSAGGQYYKFVVSDLAADRNVTLPLLAAADTFVFANFIQTLTNKTLDNTSTITLKDTNLSLQDDGDAAKIGTFQLSGITTGNTRVLTWPDFNGTIATLAGTETLSAKTLTAPKLASGGFLADANGNELIIFTTTASAVNEITYANGATGANPTITASGETNVGITITGKGTKGVTIGNALQNTVVVLADGATPALDASLGNVFVLTAAGNRTIAVPSNAVSGQKIVIRHEASGGARTLALNTGAGGFRFGTDIPALTATTSAKSDYITCIYDATDSFWDVVAVVKGF